MGEEKLKEKAKNETPQKAYTGVWVPACITERRDLLPLEKWLWAEIAGFGDCWASNAYLAERVGASERWVSACISKLISLGLVKKVGFNGRMRVIRARTEPARVEPQFQADWNCGSRQTRTVVLPENKEENKEENKLEDTKVSSNVRAVARTVENKNEMQKTKNETALAVGEDKRKPEIDEILNYWQECTGVPVPNRKSERIATWNLLRKYGAQKVRGMVDAVAVAQNSRYAPRIATPSALQKRLPDLVVWWKQSRAEERESVGDVIVGEGARLK